MHTHTSTPTYPHTHTHTHTCTHTHRHTHTDTHIQGLGTNEAVLIEIILTKTNEEIVALKQRYQEGAW